MVVTKGDASEWKYAPFEGRLAGHRIYGKRLVIPREFGGSGDGRSGDKSTGVPF